jgi:hypothetical protein
MGFSGGGDYNEIRNMNLLKTLICDNGGEYILSVFSICCEQKTSNLNIHCL